MKIAIDARIIATGTGRYMERLVHYLEQIDDKHEYTVIVRPKDKDYYKPSKPNFRVVTADFADYSFGEQLGFAKFLYDLKADLVHFCMPQQPLPYTKLAVTTVHDLNLLRITANDDMGPNELRIKKAIFRGLLWTVARRSKHILAPTQFTKDDLVKFSHINPNKITVTYEGADKTDAKPKPIKEFVGKQFIMYVGRAEPYKNNRGLIEAHQRLLTKYPKLQLVIVGKIDILRQADKDWVDVKGYKNITFTGFLSDEEVAWLYEHTQAYVFASFMEGFGLPALEAMGYGAPLVSSNATCLPEVYKTGAHYFDPHDTEDIARAVDEVLADKKLQHRLRTEGKKVHASYSWKRMAEETLAVYTKVLERHK